MKGYSVVVEFSAEGGVFVATVPGLPIVVQGDTEERAIGLAREAIRFYFEEEPRPAPSEPTARVVAVRA